MLAHSQRPLRKLSYARVSGTPRTWAQRSALILFALAAVVPAISGFVLRGGAVLRCSVAILAVLLMITGPLVNLERRRDGRRRGLLGILTILAGVLMGLWSAGLFALHASGLPEFSLAQRCQANLRTIGIALHAYRAANNGHFPPTLDAILPTVPAQAFICPEADQGAEGLSYLYLGTGKRLDRTPVSDRPDSVLMYEPQTNHPSGAMHVLFLDGHVESISPDTAAAWEARAPGRPQSTSTESRPQLARIIRAGTAPGERESSSSARPPVRTGRPKGRS